MLLLVLAFAVATPSLPRMSLVVANDTNLSRYTLEVDFDPDTRLLAGALVLDWRNTTGQAQRSLYFRLYPNAPHYGDGATKVTEVSIDGRAVDARLWSDQTVLQLDVGKEVGAGARAEIAMSFETTIPATSRASFGILSGDLETGWRLADWYPILASWEHNEGWFLDPPTRFGDPTFADSAFYVLELTAPDDYQVLGSGMTVDETIHGSTDQVTLTIKTAPGRDLTLSLLPDARAGMIGTRERNIGGFTVRVSVPQEEAIPGLGDAIIDIAEETLPLYESWLGEYPDRELDITTAPLGGASGVAWHGVVWLDIQSILPDGQLSSRSLDALRFVLGHELAHQWIAGIVGSNNNDHGFMSEGLANIVALLAIREVYGVDEAERVLRAQVVAGYLAMLESGEDGVADAAIANDSDIGARAQLVYGKGALGLEAIRQTIGNQVFLEALAAYAIECRFRVSDPDDLHHAFEEAAGTNLDSLWSFWFLEERTTAADVDAILARFS